MNEETDVTPRRPQPLAAPAQGAGTFASYTMPPATPARRATRALAPGLARGLVFPRVRKAFRIPRAARILAAAALAGSLSSWGLAAGEPVQAPKHARKASAPAVPSSCITCHGRLTGAPGAPLAAWTTDVHAGAGLGCESCHGGDPAPNLAADRDAAMSASHGFQRRPDRLRVAEFCARCHSDASYMKRYNPQMRVDQLSEYKTSVHGKLNAAGDPVPATCTDCHGAHGIRPVTSPDSPVYAAHVPETCGRCHSDTQRMARYGIPTNQFADYRASVHGAALLERGDTAAPACNDCHGNHGASPPGLSSIANVCGQCHGREAALFQASFKKDLFSDLGVAECSVCHDHHRIHHPTPDLFHRASAPEVSKGRVLSAEPFSAEIGDLGTGEKASANWRIVLRPSTGPDDARLIHKVEVSAEGVAAIVVDATIRPGSPLVAPLQRRTASPEIAASLTLELTAGLPLETGDAIRLRLDVENVAHASLRALKVRDLPGAGLESIQGSACANCHSPGDACDQATERMYAALSSLDIELRQAGVVLRRAEIAGMEVSGALFDLKRKGTTAAVEARALIHSFDPDRLITRTGEGRKVAAAALAAGHAALDEMQYRRKGLAVSLLLVAAVLLALALKIRQVNRLGEGSCTNF